LGFGKISAFEAFNQGSQPWIIVPYLFGHLVVVSGRDGTLPMIAHDKFSLSCELLPALPFHTNISLLAIIPGWNEITIFSWHVQLFFLIQPLRPKLLQ
jgi:hypothetical protein